MKTTELHWPLLETIAFNNDLIVEESGTSASRRYITSHTCFDVLVVPQGDDIYISMTKAML